MTNPFVGLTANTEALTAVEVIQKHYGYEDDDIFANGDGSFIISAPLSTIAFFIGRDGHIRCGKLIGWRDYEVRDV
jgi:hypothetical protein